MRLPKMHFLLFLSIIFLFVFSSCVKDTYDMEKISLKAELKPGYFLPLAYGTINIEDIIPTNDTIRKVGDSIIIVLNTDTLFSIEISEIIDINSEDIGGGIESDYHLGIVDLNDINFEKVITLQELASNLAPATEAAIDSADGTNAFPAVNNEDGGTYPAIQDDKYEYVTFSNGRMVMLIHNDFATTIDNITINVNDGPDHDFSHDFLFNNIQPDQTVTDSVSLIGEKAYNPFNFHISNINISQNLSTSRPISLNGDSVLFRSNLKDLEVASGNARFNRPEGIDSVANQVINLADKPDVKLRKLTLATGGINYNVVNGIGEIIRIVINLPNTTSGGIPISKEIVVNPNSTVNDVINLAGSVTDLVVDGNPNTFAVNYQVTVDSSGEYVPFDSSDAVNYNFSFDNIEYEIIEGYFGQETIDETSSTTFPTGEDDFLSRFEGSFKLSEPRLTLNYENSIGLPISFDLDLSSVSDDGTNTASTSEILKYPSVIGNLENDSIILDKSDGMDDVLTFPLPDSLNYVVAALTNPTDTTVTDNFITNESKLFFGMNMEIPLALSSERFSLEETIPLDIPDEISFDYLGVTFGFVNEFPFNAWVTVTPWDSANDETYDPVIDNLVLKATEVDANGVTIEGEPFSALVEVDSEGFDDLLASDHVIINVAIDTKGPDDPNGPARSVRILTSYKIDVNVSIKAAFGLSRIPDFGGKEEE